MARTATATAGRGRAPAAGGFGDRMRFIFRRALALLVVLALILCALAAAYFLWFKDSSLVAVEKVKIKGLSGPQSAQIKTSLREAGLAMTTLNVSESELKDAVSGFAEVEDVQASTSFPHDLTITVKERPAVAAVQAGDGAQLAVAADGTVLQGVDTKGLPKLTVPATNAKDGQIGDRRTLAAVDVVAAAPAKLGEMVTKVTMSDRGLKVQLRNGPLAYFGTSQRLEAKWAAVAAVLADPANVSATYIDVTVPERPAIGGLGGASSADTQSADSSGGVVAQDPAMTGGTPDIAPTDETDEADTGAVDPDAGGATDDAAAGDVGGAGAQ